MRQRINRRRNGMNGVQRSWHGVNEIYCVLPTYPLFTCILMKSIIVNFGEEALEVQEDAPKLKVFIVVCEW